MAALTVLDIPVRPSVLGEWLREGDLGYLYAPRGHGKTWMAMLIAKAIAAGEAIGEWSKGERCRRVVYFDAEMNLPDVKQRAELLGMDQEGVELLHHERIFDVIKRGLNIASLADQDAISGLLEDGDVFVIDNLSTASAGMGENDNDDFDMIKGWLLKLRSRRITVIIIHHAGRNGNMRGASRREDMAHWIISLKEDTGEDGVTRWVTSFKKCRNCPAKEAPSLRWTVVTKCERMEVSCEKHSGPDALLGLIRDGLVSAGELATELGVTPGCVSKWAKSLIAAGSIRKSGREYASL